MIVGEWGLKLTERGEGGTKKKEWVVGGMIRRKVLESYRTKMQGLGDQNKVMISTENGALPGLWWYPWGSG